MNHLIQYIKFFVIVFYVLQSSRLVKLGDFAEYLSEISYLLPAEHHLSQNDKMHLFARILIWNK